MEPSERPEESPKPADPLVGTRIDERYLLIARIGEGGMGAVYEGEHLLMKKRVAIKLVHPELGRLDEIARRFEREAQSASRLSHPNIIAVTDFGRSQSGALFLVMELLRGQSLTSLIAARGRLPEAEALSLLRQILRGLAHAHGQGVIHRDLKPDNIMLVPREEGGHLVKILDFGIAKITEEAPASQTLTEAGLVFGTPDYMAPEQAMGEEADPRADLYACGVILFEMLTGRKPFVGASRAEVLSMHLTREPPTPRTLVPELSGSVDRLVLRALRKKRDERFASATAFLHALDEPPPAAVAPTVAAPLPRPPKKLAEKVLDLARGHAAALWRRYWRHVSGAVGLALVLWAIGIFTHGSAPRPARPKVPVPQVAAPLERAEQALERGEHTKARAILTQQLSEHPKEARVHYLLGNVDFVEKQLASGLAAYREALRLDGGYRGDAALLRNVASALDSKDKAIATDAFDLLVKQVREPACPLLAKEASTERRLEVRRAARDACEELGCADEVDKLSSYSLDLEQGRSCEERKEAAEKLIQLDDKRALEPLRKARRARGGFLGLGHANGCIDKMLRDAIKALEAS